MAQSAAAGWSTGIHLKSSVQRQPEDSSAWRVRLLPDNTGSNIRTAALFSPTLFLETCAHVNKRLHDLMIPKHVD